MAYDMNADRGAVGTVYPGCGPSGWSRRSRTPSLPLSVAFVGQLFSYQAS
jgi:hypothetical protein